MCLSTYTSARTATSSSSSRRWIPPPEHCNECDAPVEKALTSAGLISKTSGFSAESITPEASAQFTRSAEGGRGGLRKEEVFIQKTLGFDERAKMRKKKRKKKGSS